VKQYKIRATSTITSEFIVNTSDAEKVMLEIVEDKFRSVLNELDIVTVDIKLEIVT